MRNQPTAAVRVNPDDLGRLIASCEYSSVRLRQILSSLELHGRTAQEWAGDTVSRDVAKYYNEQLYAGAHCRYATMHNYQEELLSAIDTLRNTLAAYNSTDTAAANSLEQL